MGEDAVQQPRPNAAGPDDGPIDPGGGKETPSSSRTKKVLIHLIKLSVGVAIVGFLFTRYDMNKVGHSLANADVFDFCMAWGAGLLAVVMYSLMAKFSVRPLKMEFSVWRLVKINFQIRFYGLFLPGASNMLVKWHKFSASGKQPAQALILMAFTRVAHTLALMMFAAAGIWRDRLFPWPQLQWAAAAIVLVLAISYIVLVTKPGAVISHYLANASVTARLPEFLRVKWRKLWTIAGGLRDVSFPEALLILAMGLAGHFLETLQHVYIADAVDLHLSIWVFAWLRGVILICAVLPVSLSGLGLREASMIGILVYYGVPEEMALSYSLLYFSGFVLTKGLIGGVLEGIDVFLRPARPKSAP